MSRAGQSQALFERATRVMPGGVNSPVRAFRHVDEVPRYIARAEGARLFDVDGSEYVDYVGSWGAMIAGHAHPHVVAAINRAARNGTSFGTCCEGELQLAESMVERVPMLDMVRMVNSGTEAVQSVIRLARAVTGRNKILKFDGCYHGHVDALLVSAGSGVATLGLPGSPGIPQAVTADTVTAPYNDVDAVEHVFASCGSELAGVIVEPVAGNMGVVPPADGFLATLRRHCDRHGALLIFDEVMTGFRLGRAGFQGMIDIRPDLATFGKVIGGGLPVGAYGGPASLMGRVAPAGDVYQAGTLSGNPLAMAAGLATLDLLDDAAYTRLETVSAGLEDGLRSAVESSGIEAVVQRAGSMLTLFFGRGTPVQSFGDASAADHALFGRFFRHMLRHGIHLPPSGYEAWFVSLAHGDAEIDATIRAVEAFDPG